MPGVGRTAAGTWQGRGVPTASPRLPEAGGRGRQVGGGDSLEGTAKLPRIEYVDGAWLLRKELRAC